MKYVNYLFLNFFLYDFIYWKWTLIPPCCITFKPVREIVLLIHAHLLCSLEREKTALLYFRQVWENFVHSQLQKGEEFWCRIT